jgi:tRNA(Ile)-lysidine synthase
LAHFINLTSGDLLSNPNRMSLETLLQLEPAMQALVIRQWLRSQEIPPPPEARLLEFMDQLAAGSRNSRAEVCWGNWRIKRYRNHAWLQDLTAELLCRETEWSKNCELELGPGLGRMMIQPVTQKVPQGWQIGRRRKGERLRLHQGTGRCSLKECFRQSGIPPWLRDSIPVLYWNGEAVAVGDWLLAEKLSKWLSTNQARYVWHPSDPVLRDIRDHLHH